MNFKNGIGDEQIQNVLKAHPEIGTILDKYQIACVTCKVGICLLKDVVAIHTLPKEEEDKIEKEINNYLTKKGELQ